MKLCHIYIGAVMNAGFIEKSARGGGGGGLPYITDGDTRRSFQKQPPKVTILGVATAYFIP